MARVRYNGCVSLSALTTDFYNIWKGLVFDDTGGWEWHVLVNLVVGVGLALWPGHGVSFGLVLFVDEGTVVHILAELGKRIGKSCMMQLRGLRSVQEELQRLYRVYFVGQKCARQLITGTYD